MFLINIPATALKLKASEKLVLLQIDANKGSYRPPNTKEYLALTGLSGSVFSKHIRKLKEFGYIFSSDGLFNGKKITKYRLCQTAIDEVHKRYVKDSAK